MTKMTINEEYFNLEKNALYDAIYNAKKNCPYYKKKYGFQLVPFEEFTYDYFTSNIPILEKNEIANNSYDLISKEVDINDLIVETTSGSEGVPLKCYKTENIKFRYSMDLWNVRRKIVKNLSSKDKFVHFYVSRNTDGKIINEKIFYQKNILYLPLFDMSPEKIRSYWAEICYFKPRWIHGIPSTIYNMAMYAVEKNITPPKLDLVELTGEYVDDQKFNFLKDFFKCNITNQYGAREFWLLAYGCNNNILHINDKSVFIETVYNNTYKNTELIVTSLKNNCWPLIRYRLGDIGTVQLNDCSCNIGSKYVLDLTWGRKSELCMIGSETLSKVFFSYIVRKINTPKIIVRQFQIVKKEENTIEIRVVGDESFSSVVKDIFLFELSKKIKNICVYIKYMKFIKPDDKTGKTKDYIDYTKKERSDSYD